MKSLLKTGRRTWYRLRRHHAEQGLRQAHQETVARLADALASESRPQSCIFFTIHKCASTFVDKLLATISQNSGYSLRNLESAIWELGDQVQIDGAYQPVFERHYDQLFRLRGEIYAPQRKPLDFPGRDRFKHIFFLRDPRDVLVSAYYSFGFSHSAPVGEKAREEFLKVREQIITQGIDQYALQATDEWVLDVYEGYQRIRESAPDNLFLTYDDFRLDTGAFIDRIAHYLDIEVPAERKAQLVGNARPEQARENIMSHQRSGKSEQHLKELKPETIEILNDRFANVLKYWGDGIWLRGTAGTTAP